MASVNNMNSYHDMGPTGPVGDPGMPGPTGHMPKTHMTCDEIFDKLHSHDMKDEMEVANKYLDYAVAFEKAGKDDLASGFLEMAYEEFTHAKFQKMVMIEYGYEIEDENVTMYQALKHRLEGLFRRME